MRSRRAFWSERCGGLALLTLTLPVIVTIGLAIQATSTGPVFVHVDLIGRNGSVVRRRRFRTTGAGTRPFHFIGRFLRSFALDELPSLWSVVRGEMRLGELLKSFDSSSRH